MDNEVTVRCRKADVAMVHAAVEQASTEYRTLTNKDIKVNIDESRPLAETT